MKPSALRTALAHLITVQRPPFLWGPPGVGKSDVIRQVTEDLGIELRDIRMSLLDPIDLKGFPMPDATAGVMKWLPADFLPPMMVKKGNKMVPNESKGCLFLDEMNSAPPAVQATGYQLILNRRIGEYILPKGWSVVAAGNRASDRAIVHAQPSALANRFVHLDFDVDPEEWRHWAMRNNLHTDLRAFIAFRPHLLHAFDAANNPRAFPTPRSWAFVDSIYKSNLPPSDELEVIKGTVGEGAAVEFSSFVRLIKDLPTVDQILIDPDGAKMPDSPASRYAIASALAPKTTKGNIDRIMKYTNRLPVEFQVMFIRDAIRATDELTQTKAFMDWAIKNEKVMT